MKIIRLLLIIGFGLSFNAYAQKTGQDVWLSPFGPPEQEETISAFRKIKALPSVVIEPKKAWTIRTGLLRKEEMKRAIAWIEKICEQQEPEKLSHIINREDFPLTTRLSPLNDFGQGFDLVVVTSEELGLPSVAISTSEPMWKKEIPPELWEKRVEESGYKRVPAEVAVMLILQFDQYTDPIYILPEGIVGIENPQHLGLVLYTDNYGNLGIAVRRVSQSEPAPRVFIVVKLRKP